MWVHYFMTSLVLGLLFRSLRSANQILPSAGDLKCQKGAQTLAGACAIQSEQCCLSIKGNKCRQELDQYPLFAAPQLTFFDESLFMDTRMGVLCVKGLKVPAGNRLVGNEIRGLYLKLEVIPLHSVSNTILFYGNVTWEALKQGLFCVDAEVTEQTCGIYYQLKLTTLPSAKDVQPTIYGVTVGKKYIASQEVPRRHIIMKNCQRWEEYEEDCKVEKGHLKREDPWENPHGDHFNPPWVVTTSLVCLPVSLVLGVLIRYMCPKRCCCSKSEGNSSQFGDQLVNSDENNAIVSLQNVSKTDDHASFKEDVKEAPECVLTTIEMPANVFDGCESWITEADNESHKYGTL